MGKKTLIEYYDDLTGDTAGVQPCVFGWDHQWYEIDLNQQHRDELEATLKLWLGNARLLERIPAAHLYKRRRSRYDGLPKTTLQAIRAWVQAEHGVQLQSFGRIANRWVEMWKDAGAPSLKQIKAGQTTVPADACPDDASEL